VSKNDPEVHLVYEDHYVAIYENTAALPRARIAHGVVAVRDAEEAAARLADAVTGGGSAATLGLADQVFVEPSSDGRPPPTAPGGAAAPGEYVRLLEGGDPDRVTLEARLAKPGYVVLADTFYPGWTASIDGMPTLIHPADLLFRSVFVPAGRHTIVFHYAPQVFTASVILLALGAGVSLALVVRGRMTSRASHYHNNR
jgi:hypothetical protein